MVDLRTLQSIGHHEPGALSISYSRGNYRLERSAAEWGSGESSVVHSGLFVQWLQNCDSLIKCSVDGTNFHKTGDIFCIPPAMELHCQWTPGRSRMLSVDYAGRDDEELSEMVSNLSDLDADCLFDISHGFIRAVLARLEQELDTPGFASDIMIDSLLSALVVELNGTLKRRRANPQQAALSQPELSRIRELIRETEGPLPLLSDIARACGAPSRWLSEAVREATGMTLRAYVAQERLAKARSILQDRNLLIKQVAFACGFASAAAFTAAYHKATGETPQQFRQRLS